MVDEAHDKVTTGGQDIMARLRSETRPYHDRLEALPFFTELMAHTLPMESYVAQLQALAIVIATLEREVSECSDPRIKAVWDSSMVKLPLLEADLAFFSPRFRVPANKGRQVALNMAARIRLHRAARPEILAGWLYVFEGTTWGNRMHTPDVTTTFHLRDGDGYRFYASYGDEVPVRWKGYVQRMGETFADPATHGPVLEGAHEAFDALEALYATLHPLAPSDEPFTAATINAEAGLHPVPSDEREIAAALRASERAWHHFGYYQQRFGDRGRRFSDSDTCWLTTLAALDTWIVQKQVSWLSRVLAFRGMPTVMMEHTLSVLSEEMTVAVPERQACWAKLAGAAALLRQARERWISAETARDLAGAFDATCSPEDAARYRNTGMLLVSAVADEANAMEGMAAKLQAWLSDPQRFPETWIRAVAATIEKARQVRAPLPAP